MDNYNYLYSAKILSFSLLPLDYDVKSEKSYEFFLNYKILKYINFLHVLFYIKWNTFIKCDVDFVLFVN